MLYNIHLDSVESIVLININRQVTPYDRYDVSQTIGDMTSQVGLPILLDLSTMNEPICNIAEWVLFVGHLRKECNQRIALVSSLVGHATPCQLIAFSASDANDTVQAFCSEAEARKWLKESG